jgi:hypothetical protein
MRTLLNDTLTGLLCSPEHAVASLRGVEGIAEHRIYYIFFFLLRKILKLSVMKHLLEPLCLRQLVIPLASPDFAHPASFQEDAFHSLFRRVCSSFTILRIHAPHHFFPRQEYTTINSEW